MMLFDSKIPIFPSGPNAAGTLPNGWAWRNVSVFNSFTPVSPTRPVRAREDNDWRSCSASGRAS